MQLIKTGHKDKLPKGFSYPLGAEAISAALDGIPQADTTGLRFSWRKWTRLPEWRKLIKNHGPFLLFRFHYFNYFGSWHGEVYAVPTEYVQAARQRLEEELPGLRSLLISRGEAITIRAPSIWLSAADAEKGRAVSPVMLKPGLKVRE